MLIKGKTWRFGDDIDTDAIIPARYLNTSDPAELARHIMEDADKDFPAKVKAGDVIVAGKNFGCGSSREHAPIAIKAAGIQAVVAKSFARIFYRNAFNIGLALIETDTEKIAENDLIDIDMDKGIIRNLTKNIEFPVKPFPKFMQELLKEGGIINYYRKHGALPEV